MVTGIATKKPPVFSYTPDEKSAFGVGEVTGSFSLFSYY
jgi:hypothetical protein